jgi:DNA-binding NarL/FixJ family response regulator
MKEQMISFGPSIHILCFHPLVSRIIERTLAASGYRVHPSSVAQLQTLGEYEYILIIDTHSVERWLEMTIRYGFMKKQPVILLIHSLTRQEESRVLYLGVRGIVPIADLENELIPAVESVSSKRLWISRNTLNEYFMQGAGSVDPSPKCTSREQQIMACLIEGFANKEIGQILGISPRTVKFHVTNILQKFRVKNRRGLRGIQNSQKSKPLLKIPA